MTIHLQAEKRLGAIFLYLPPNETQKPVIMRLERRFIVMNVI